MTNVSTNPTFALFLDIMGVQQRLVDADDVAMADCREISERFHSYLDEVVRREIDAIAAGGVWHAPRFVAEFSDSAYVVADEFLTLVATAVLMMRRALRHKYPLRGGIGFGTFSHETSGSSVRGQEQVWSTSSFFGSAIVTAYRAERSPALGLRIFVHPAAADQVLGDPEREPALNGIPLLESDTFAAHEVRTWNPHVAGYAKDWMLLFQREQRLSERAVQHYDATLRAYDRLMHQEHDLPFDPPMMWVLHRPVIESG